MVFWFYTNRIFIKMFCRPHNNNKYIMGNIINTWRKIEVLLKKCFVNSIKS